LNIETKRNTGANYFNRFQKTKSTESDNIFKLNKQKDYFSMLQNLNKEYRKNPNDNYFSRLPEVKQPKVRRNNYPRPPSFTEQAGGEQVSVTQTKKSSQVTSNLNFNINKKLLGRTVQNIEYAQSYAIPRISLGEIGSKSLTFGALNYRTETLTKTRTLTALRQDSLLRTQTKTRTLTALRQDSLLRTQTRSLTALKQDTLLRTQTKTKTTQKNQLKQTFKLQLNNSLFKSNTVTNTGFNPNFNFKAAGAFSIDKNNKNKFKPSVKVVKSSKLSYGYNPSLEAGLFNIRAGKKDSFRLANTGLVLRPFKR
jgi:hypothetical protein